MSGARRRLLSLSTLYPNAATPRFGTFVARSLEALARRGEWDITLINPIGVPPIAFGRYRALAAAAVDGMEQGVHVMRPRFPLIPRLGGPINPALIARAVLPIARKLHAEEPFDLVDAQFFYPDGPAAMRIAHALGLPYSVKARGADIQMWGHRRLTGPQVLAAGRNAAGMLAVSEAMAHDMAALGLPREAITIHYTGLDRDRFRPTPRNAARKRLLDAGIVTLSADKPFLVSVGALIPRKGQALVIRALAQLPDTVLGLVGKGPDEASLLALARDLGVAGRVRFLGSLDHDQLPQVLSAADALVLPSASEGLANAWVEALACGTPIVISDAGGAAELLQDPVAGRIVERTPDSIAAALAELLNQPPSPGKVAATVSQFSWDLHAERLATYYAGLLQPSARAARS